jgi:hypothetical protein
LAQDAQLHERITSWTRTVLDLSEEVVLS